MTFPFLMTNDLDFLGLNVILAHVASLYMGASGDGEVVHEATAWRLPNISVHFWTTGFPFTSFYDHIHSHNEQYYRDGTPCNNAFLETLPRCCIVNDRKSQLDPTKVTADNVDDLIWNVVVF